MAEPSGRLNSISLIHESTETENKVKEIKRHDKRRNVENVKKGT